MSTLGCTEIWNSRSAFFGAHQASDGGSSSLSSTQKFQVPDCVGLPLTVPLDESERPGGSAPFVTRYW